MKVTVRIAVAVDSDGDWCSCGWSRAEDGEMEANVADGLGEHFALCWLTAELEVPKPPTAPTIAAKVEVVG